MSNRAELGIDGNCGYALVGRDLQEGEAEFVEIPENSPSGKRWAAKQALLKLRERLGRPELGYYFGPSHPYGE